MKQLGELDIRGQRHHIAVTVNVTQRERGSSRWEVWCEKFLQALKCLALLHGKTARRITEFDFQMNLHADETRSALLLLFFFLIILSEVVFWVEAIRCWGKIDSGRKWKLVMRKLLLKWDVQERTSNLCLSQRRLGWQNRQKGDAVLIFTYSIQWHYLTNNGGCLL